MSDNKQFGNSEQLEASHKKDHVADTGKMVGDLISRQVLLDAIRKLEKPAPTAQHLSAIFDCEDTIKALPSAQPERKKGKWLSHYDYCEKHGYIPSGLIAFWWCNQCEKGVEIQTNFCPNCGADMRGENGG